jgi:hypothetical protein
MGTTLFRIHRAIHGPWFFDGSQSGRFNPTRFRSRGACYWAEDALGAWIEVFRTQMTLTTADVANRRISRMKLTAPLEVVDLTGREALRAGATAAIGAGADYTDAHRLANALQRSGRGIRWRVRHDLEQQLLGIVIFGPRGAIDSPSMSHLGETTTREITPQLVGRAERVFGYRVLPNPAA